MSVLDIFKSESSKVEIENLKNQILKYKEIIIHKENEINEQKRLIELKEEKYKEAYGKIINLNLEIEQSEERLKVLLNKKNDLKIIYVM